MAASAYRRSRRFFAASISSFRASMTFRFLPSIAILLTFTLSAQTPAPTAQTKPPLTLDAFIAATEYSSARLSLDGSAAVIATREPDWTANRFRDDLLIWS